MLISPARRLSWSSISGAKRRFSIQKRCRKVDTQERIQVCWIASASWSGYRFKRKRPDGARAASIFTKLHQMVMELWEMLRKNFLSTTNCKLKANKDMKIDEENMNTSRLPGLVWEMKNIFFWIAVHANTLMRSMPAQMLFCKTAHTYLWTFEWYNFLLDFRLRHLLVGWTWAISGGSNGIESR